MALKVGELYSTLELDARKFNQGITAAQTQVKGMSTMLKVGLAGAAVAAGAALYKMAKTGLQNVRELDNAVKQFQVATGASAAEAEKAQKVIQKLYRQNTDSYAELGAAVTRLQQRYGDLGDDLGKHTQSFLDFAKVTGQDATQAIDDVTNVLIAFNKDLDEAVPLMDSLLAVSQKTGASLPTLQQALAKAAPAMSALNIPLEEGIALLGHLESRGVSADTAVQGLRYAMQALENPTKEQTRALEKLGIAFTEAEDGTIKVAEDAFPTLLKRLSEGSLSAKETEAAIRILGMRAGQDMVRGLEDGEEGIRSLMETIKESEGVVNEASEVYDKQLGERWELIRRQYLVPFMEWMGDILLTTLESVATFIETWGPRVVAVFEAVSSAIDKVVSAIRSVVERTQELYEGGKNAIVSWGEGIKAGASSAVEAAKGVASRVAGFFVGESPPPEGPLSTIDLGGQRLIEAWADGMLMAEDYVETVVGQISDTVVSEMKRTNEQVMSLQAGYRDWFSTLESGLESAITGTRTLSEVLRDIAKQLANKMLQALLFGGAGGGGLFGGLFGSLFHSGGVIQSGRLLPFARGGIVTSPTIFPMANGAGLMGEAGPEAIMPLKRTSSGELGVKAEGAGVTNITMNINAVDANSFVQMLRHNKAAITSLVVENILSDGQIRRTIQGVT